MKGNEMKTRRSGLACGLALSILALVGCTPVTDGVADGLTDGFSAATSAFIEELAASLVQDVVPDGGA